MSVPRYVCEATSCARDFRGRVAACGPETGKCGCHIIAYQVLEALVDATDELYKCNLF